MKYYRCETKASIPLDAVQGQRGTPIWKREAGYVVGPAAGNRRHRPSVYMVGLASGADSSGR